jgi:hypothetical protein
MLDTVCSLAVSIEVLSGCPSSTSRRDCMRAGCHSWRGHRARVSDQT